MTADFRWTPCVEQVGSCFPNFGNCFPSRTCNESKEGEEEEFVLFRKSVNARTVSQPLSANMLEGTESREEGVHTMTADFRWTPRVEQVGSFSPKSSPFF